MTNPNGGRQKKVILTPKAVPKRHFTGNEQVSASGGETPEIHLGTGGFVGWSRCYLHGLVRGKLRKPPAHPLGMEYEYLKQEGNRLKSGKYRGRWERVFFLHSRSGRGLERVPWGKENYRMVNRGVEQNLRGLEIFEIIPGVNAIFVK